MELAPVILFVYNRLDHTQKTLSSLSENELASESHLYIFSDGPKDEASRIAVEAVRSHIQTISGFAKVTVTNREVNCGLAANIIEGVTRIIEQYGKVIVMEDDIVTSPYFLRFMNDALSKYETESNVWHISGYTPRINVAGIDTHFFIKPTSCWGWGTWKDRWSFFKKDPEFFLNQFNDAKIKDFNLKNSYNYHSHIVSNLEKKINTWAIFWYATVYFNNGLSLHPRKSFVENIGHDESGTHCVSTSDYDVDLVKSYEDCFPVKVELNPTAEKAFIDYNNSMKKTFKERLLSFIARKLRK